ncbi:MAG: hypothetical protein WC575_04770 [Patescibacteria group bacterium]
MLKIKTVVAAILSLGLLFACDIAPFIWRIRNEPWVSMITLSAIVLIGLGCWQIFTWSRLWFKHLKPLRRTSAKFVANVIVNALEEINFSQKRTSLEKKDLEANYTDELLVYGRPPTKSYLHQMLASSQLDDYSKKRIKLQECANALLVDAAWRINAVFEKKDELAPKINTMEKAKTCAGREFTQTFIDYVNLADYKQQIDTLSRKFWELYRHIKNIGLEVLPNILAYRTIRRESIWISNGVGQEVLKL